MRQALISITVLAGVLLGVIAVALFWPTGTTASDPDLESTIKQHFTAWIEEKSSVDRQVELPSGGLSRPATPADSPNKGAVYTYRDGDRTVRVIQQDSLTVQPSGKNTTDDVVLHQGTLNSIVERQAHHGSETLPVFRSESGGELMTLPGGVLLLLDSTWTEDEVQDFFTNQGIATESASPLGYIPNGYQVATSPGFPSLQLANSLAEKDGVMVSSPNWWREVDAR